MYAYLHEMYFNIDELIIVSLFAEYSVSTKLEYGCVMLTMLFPCRQCKHVFHVFNEYLSNTSLFKASSQNMTSPSIIFSVKLGQLLHVLAIWTN